MGELIHLSDYRNPGNGARELVEEYFERFPNAGPIGDVIRADHFLAWLWHKGFMVGPVPADAPSPTEGGE